MGNHPKHVSVIRGEAFNIESKSTKFTSSCFLIKQSRAGLPLLPHQEGTVHEDGGPHQTLVLQYLDFEL